MILRVSAPSRVHLTLIDLGRYGYRRNGGLGFGISEPRTSLAFTPTAKVDLRALGSSGYNSIEIAALTARLEDVKNKQRLTHGLTLVDAQLPTRHGGFGTGTAVALASLESLFLLNDRSVHPDSLRSQSGRGGASGIGLRSYFNGGFIFDAGRKFSADPIIGSDATAEVSELPLEIARLDMAPWPIGIFIPAGTQAISLEQEREFFSKQLPLPDTAVFEIAYHAIFGSLAAVKSGDYDAFCASVNALQRCAWKRAEIDLHGRAVRFYADHLASIGCDAVAMSSIGPALVFWARDFDKVFSAAVHQYGPVAVLRTSPDNTGRIISYD